jgi:HAD superfamily hydrolase (TIGR01490 family)
LGEELFEKVLKPSLFRGAPDLIRRSKQDGVTQVLVTGALDFVTEPLARYLDVDHWVANRLEFRDGFATGNIVKPVLAGGEKARWVRRWAEQNGYDLDASFAYADSYSDYSMLSIVGNPVATNPEFKLKAAARAADWPVLHLE